MTYNYLKFSNANGIAHLTLNRPEKCNALDGPLIQELLTVLAKLTNDETVRVLLIDGEVSIWVRQNSLLQSQKDQFLKAD